MTVQLGSIIWTAVRAILKFVLTAACGTLLARAKLLDSNGTRAISQCILNVFLPCLLFNKIVVGIDRENMKQVGVLALTSILYTVIGLAFGFVVKFFTRVPRGWESGVLAAGAFSNWGDLPLVVIGTIVDAAPFNGSTDEAKGLAYVAVYMFVQSTIMFVFNGVWLVSRDFDHPIGDHETQSVISKVKRIGSKMKDYKQRAYLLHSQHFSKSTDATEDQEEPHSGLKSEPDQHVRHRRDRKLRPGESLGLARISSAESLFLRPVTSGVLHHGDINSSIESSSIVRKDSGQIADAATKNTVVLSTSPSSIDASDAQNAGSRDRVSFPQIWQHTKSAIKRLLSPPSAATISGFVIAVVPVLKALFVVVSEVSMPSAPDGKPPLDFILDITSFIGAASVPSSLLILGYSLSRLQVSKLPGLSSALLMAVLKMVVLPIIAVAWMQFLASPKGLIDPTDLVLRLVLVLPSAVPTATSLLYITQIFAPEGRDEGVQCLSVFLIVQYLLVGLTLTITVVYTLDLIT